MYRCLREGLLPKIYPAKSILEIGRHRIKEALRSGDLIKNEIALIKPLAIRKAVVITGTNFSGYRTTFRNAYVGKRNDTLIFEVNYKNQLARPTAAKIVQKMGDVRSEVHVLFMRHAPYTFKVEKPLTDPASLTCSAEVISETGLFRYDSTTQRYDVGLFDDSYKPVSEYPVPEANNVELDIKCDWKVGNSVYPTPLPEGLTIDSLSVEFLNGFMEYEDKLYKDPAVNNTVRIRARIVNKTGRTIKVEHWGLPLTAVYEDDLHVSQVDVAVNFPRRTIYNGASYSYYLDVNLPDWCYGKVAVAHAMNIYKNGLYCYGGGPLFCFEVFRLRLP